MACRGLVRLCDECGGEGYDEEIECHDSEDGPYCAGGCKCCGGAGAILVCPDCGHQMDHEQNWRQENTCPWCDTVFYVEDDDICGECGGTGHIEEVVTCLDCQGSGIARRRGEHGCKTCGGQGKVFLKNPCEACRGLVRLCDECGGMGHNEEHTTENHDAAEGHHCLDTQACESCDGAGKFLVCPKCGQWIGLGPNRRNEYACPQCDTVFYVEDDDICGECGGTGHIEEVSTCPDCQDSGDATVPRRPFHFLSLGKGAFILAPSWTRLWR